MGDNPYQSPTTDADEDTSQSVGDRYTPPPLEPTQQNRQREVLSTILLVIGIIVVAAIIFIVSIPV